MESHGAAPTYQYKPFGQHIDGGFGAIGDAFYEAASRLEKYVEESPFFNLCLPVAYLHRHAAELFLKSCIILVRRALEVPFGVKQTDQATIRIDDKCVPIYHVHSIGDLYRHLTELFQGHIERLTELTTTDRRTIPTELAQWIAQIEEFDQRGTLFRYPGPGDELKSDFRRSSVTEIWSPMAPDREHVRGFLQFDEEDNLVGAFCFDPSRLRPIMDALRKTSRRSTRSISRCDRNWEGQLKNRRTKGATPTVNCCVLCARHLAMGCP